MASADVSSAAWARGSGSAAQPEEEGMLALLAVQGVVLVIEVQNVFFSLKSKLLVEQHSRIARRDVKGYVFAHAGLPGKKDTKQTRGVAAREQDSLWQNVEGRRFSTAGSQGTKEM